MKVLDVTYSFTTEEYSSIAVSTDNKRYPIFINPDKSEIAELNKESSIVRFIMINKDIYVFSGSLLHAMAIKNLGLPLTAKPSVQDAFLGLAKISNGKLEYYDSNQLDRDNHRDLEDIGRLYYRQFEKYF